MKQLENCGFEIVKLPKNLPHKTVVKADRTESVGKFAELRPAVNSRLSSLENLLASHHGEFA
jgi:hypothetical protein